MTSTSFPSHASFGAALLALSLLGGPLLRAAIDPQPFAYAKGTLNEQEDRSDTPRTGKLLPCLAGDSTVTYSQGYAAGLRAHLDRQLQVINRSRGGRTTASFRADGRWQDILKLKPDYVMIQFGHNDAVMNDETLLGTPPGLDGVSPSLSPREDSSSA